MESKIWPWEYTIVEGGNFRLWKYGYVTRKQLHSLIREIGGVNSFINGVQVHSLIFESASAGYGNYARWDCVNGWTTTIAQAKKNFPGGLHGKKRFE